jgi:nucleoside-diphosphate-sugar epimerase
MKDFFLPGKLSSRSRYLACLNEAITDQTKILVNGASGWLGMNISESLCSVFGEKFKSSVLLTGSRDQVVQLTNGTQLQVHQWSRAIVSDFAPTQVIQLAFKTRDHVSHVSLEDYIKTNEEIIDHAIWMISLPSVKGFLHTSSGAVLGVNTDDKYLDPYGYLKKFEESQYADACMRNKKNYLGLRVWSITGRYIKTGDVFAIENLITQALKGSTIEIKSDCQTYRTYADANEILVASLIGLLMGKTGLYNSGGYEIEIGDLSVLISGLAPDYEHVFVRPNDSSKMEDRFCSEGRSIEDVLLELGLTFSSMSCQVLQTMEYLKEVR